jgi:hypothetical protein
MTTMHPDTMVRFAQNERLRLNPLVWCGLNEDGSVTCCAASLQAFIEHPPFLDDVRQQKPYTDTAIAMWLVGIHGRAYRMGLETAFANLPHGGDRMISDPWYDRGYVLGYELLMAATAAGLMEEVPA